MEPITKRIFALRAGVAAHSSKVAQIVRYYITHHEAEIQQPVAVYSVAKHIQTLSYQNKNYLQASSICAGWDPYKGPQIYTIPIGGTLVAENIAKSGSGADYMSGYCDANFKLGMTRKECRDFVATAISLSMYRDSSSGGIIRLVDISKDAVTREYITHDKLEFK